MMFLADPGQLAVDEQQAKRLRSKNLKTALILASLALAFLLALVVRRLI